MSRSILLISITLGLVSSMASGAPKKADPRTLSPQYPEADLGQEILDDVDSQIAPDRKAKAVQRRNVMDDFTLIDSRMKRTRLKEKTKTPDEYADAEIAKLRTAEIKRQDFDQRESRQRELQRQRDLREELAEQKRENHRIEKQLKPEIDALPYVTEDDMNWRGLD